MVTQGASGVERRLAKLAARQHGVVTVDQLRALGINAAAARQRARRGRLHRVHRGVYAVGHSRLSNEGRWMAAVLACGPEVALSHRSAAELWRMLTPRQGPVDVLAPGTSGRRQRPGIRLHRSTTLTQQATTRRSGISVTNPARTLTDLRKCASADELSRARRQAEFFGYRLDPPHPKPIERSRNKLERRFVRLCQRHHLPTPLVNAPLLGYEVDFLWPHAKLVVETDGYDAHSGRESIEHDRRREARLAAAGYEVLRFTWHQVTERPYEVIAALRTRLIAPLTSTGS